MNYCLNPKCPNPTDPMNAKENTCRNCGAGLLLEDRYRVIQPLGRGGFGQTFEVDDQGTLKVLKVLNPTSFSDPIIKKKVIALFQQEADVLSQLHHPGIPKVEPEGDFTFWLPDSKQPLHCFVMERIDGLNLQQWLANRDNQPITVVQALSWLQQLTAILEQLHQKQYFHRDIKPSNIMLRPDGQLVLIDFGAVRELTETYLQRQQNVTGTRIGSPGYIPPEQSDGRAVPQSDFFALGRTFVHLLTGKHPCDLPEDPETGKLIWRNHVPHTSNSWVNVVYKLLGRSLLDFIDELMEPSWKKRPKNTRVISKRLNKILRAPLVEFATVAAVLLGLGATGIYWYATGVNGCSKIWLRSFPISDNLSCGEEFLVSKPTIEQQQGASAFVAGNYAEAVSKLEQAWQKQRNPETLIYLNNTRLAAQNVEARTLAIAVPINDKSLDTAQEILRGIAQAQDEVNRKRKATEPGLKVLIVNDDNDPIQGKAIAKALVSKKDVLAVIGHYASDVTLAAMPVYEQHQLVLISPGSTSTSLPPPGSHFFFRTVPNTQVNAYALATYLLNQTGQQTASVYYDPSSIFSQSLRDQFSISFAAIGGRIIKEFDLSEPAFRASSYINQGQKQGATALVILPDANINPHTFENALKVIKANQGRYQIMGGNTVYSPKTLEFAGQEAVNRLVVAVPWHHLSSPNPEFAQSAETLWGGQVSSRTALTYDAARALITVLEKPSHPSRTRVQQMLTDPTFQAQGATGTVSFEPNGNRKEPVVELVKVVPSSCSPYGFMFVPVSYPTAKVERLDCGKNN